MDSFPAKVVPLSDRSSSDDSFDWVCRDHALARGVSKLSRNVLHDLLNPGPDTHDRFDNFRKMNSFYGYDIVHRALLNNEIRCTDFKFSDGERSEL